MKYLFNKGRYGVAFEVSYKGKPTKVEFDRRRIYLDTGNIATSGVTPVEDDLYEELYKSNKRFKHLVDTKELELVEEKDIKGTSGEVDVLKAENEKLKKELKEANKKSSGGANKTAEKELKAKDEEIKNLKAQLEALKKSDKETEGF